MRQRTTERAACADRMMADVTHDGRQKLAKRAVADRSVERRMPYQRADAELAKIDLDAFELFDTVDVDQVSRPRQSERHDRDQALPARKHTAVFGRDLRQ